MKKKTTASSRPTRTKSSRKAEKPDADASMAVAEKPAASKRRSKKPADPQATAVVPPPDSPVAEVQRVENAIVFRFPSKGGKSSAGAATSPRPPAPPRDQPPVEDARPAPPQSHADVPREEPKWSDEALPTHESNSIVDDDAAADAERWDAEDRADFHEPRREDFEPGDDRGNRRDGPPTHETRANGRRDGESAAVGRVRRDGGPGRGGRRDRGRGRGRDEARGPRQPAEARGPGRPAGGREKRPPHGPGHGRPPMHEPPRAAPLPPVPPAAPPPQADRRPPLPAGDDLDMRNLTPSQKRRLRRRRARERRRAMEQGTPLPGVAAPRIDDLGDDRSQRGPHNAPPEDEAPPHAAFHGGDVDDVDDDDRDDLPIDVAGEEVGESLDLARTSIPEIESEPPFEEPADAADRDEPADEPAAPVTPGDRETGGRGRRGRGRGRERGHGHGRGRDRGRRYAPESDDADVRVYGEGEESAAVEIEPDSDESMGVVADIDDTAPVTGRHREMLINVVPREECRIAILEDGRLEQIYIERASAESHVGNIYKGVVTNVEPSIQAAFVDFGLGKNGFLHISDLHPQYFPGGDDHTENVGRKLPRKNRPPIQRCLRRGQEVIVQITKEGIGTKGPTLTNYLAIPGRFLVMMPGMGQLGVSRKIEDEETRRRVRSALNELELPGDIGFIARTAAEGRSKRELQADLNYLTRLWRAVEKRSAAERAPCEIYRDSDLVIRTIRDVYTSDVQRILVDDKDVAERAREFLAIFSEKAAETVVHFDAAEPLFHKFGIEAELERLHSRHVPLRSGGSLVIDQTEALVAIDVNSGRFRAEDDAETTALRINTEAADEIPRQLRLRDLGGVIICDFIDMRREEYRREIERKLIKNLKQHKERAKVLRMSQFGIIEMTRQRQRASLTRSVYQDCHHCRGTGLIKTPESVALDVMRLITFAATREHIRSIEITVSPDVAYMLQNRKRAAICDLEAQQRRSISVRPDATVGVDHVNLQCFDHRGRLVPHT